MAGSAATLIDQGIALGSRAVCRLPFTPTPERYQLTVGSSPSFLWFRVPKVGTRTILQVLDGVDGVVQDPPGGNARYALGLYRSHLSFAFVRNPWGRLVSAWTDKVVRSNHFDLAPAELAELQSFPAFARWTAARDLTRGNGHIRLMTKLVDAPSVDVLGRMESFGPDLEGILDRIGLPGRTVPRLNQNPTTDYRSHYDEATRRLVGDAYGPDVEAFRYTFDGGD